MSKLTSRSTEMERADDMDADYDFVWPGLAETEGSERRRAVPFAPYDDDGYDLLRELTESAPDAATEHPLDTAMRTNDQAMRCYYEEHGEKATKLNWGSLAGSVRATYKRLPIVQETDMPSGTFFVRTYEGKVQPIPEENAREHPMFAFQAL